MVLNTDGLLMPFDFGYVSKGLNVFLVVSSTHLPNPIYTMQLQPFTDT